MKITDVTLTLFAWESIPSTIYGHHTARPTGKSDLGLLAVTTDQGVVGHAFLGTSSNPASLDGPGLIRFLKPILLGQDPLDRERLNRLLWARAPAPLGCARSAPVTSRCGTSPARLPGCRSIASSARRATGSPPMPAPRSTLAPRPMSNRPGITNRPAGAPTRSIRRNLGAKTSRSVKRYAKRSA